jgi:predicted ribosome quality control (RQC) complex YloA/Tae2 family protein
VAERPQAPPAPAPFCRILRGHLRGSRLERIGQISNDRLVAFVFTAGGRCSYVVHQLFGRTPNLILLDGEKRVVASLAPVRQGGTSRKIGDAYDFSPPAASSASRGFQPAPRGSRAAPETLETLAVSRELDRRYGEAERASLLAERRAAMLRQLRRSRERCRRTLGKVTAELEAARARRRDRELGELLKGAFGQLRRGMDSVVLADYFHPEMPAVSIPLDPALKPQENVERYFKRHRKAQRAVSALSARRQALAGEERSLAALEEKVRGAATPAALEELAGQVAPPGRRAARPGRPGKQSRPEAGGPRRFVSADGYEILVGRSALENEQLTFRLARGNDLFLHASGRPGAHVVVRRPPGREVSAETLLDAAQLALYYSFAERSARLLEKGIKADVDYTPVKYVRKPRGAKAGAVLLARHKTVRVELERARLERLLGKIGGVQNRPSEGDSLGG